MDDSQSAGISELVGNCPLACGTVGVSETSVLLSSTLFAALEVAYNIVHLKLLGGASISGMLVSSGGTLVSSVLDYVVK